jgi:hypothetical protein
MSQIYSHGHNGFFDKILIKKRKEMKEVIIQHLNNEKFSEALDIGTTNDLENESSNYLIKNLPNITLYRSISNQKIENKFFSKSLNKSILSEFSAIEIQDFKSELVISNATIEHVGKFENQIKMVENIIKLSKKFFIINTPNRYHPLEFHTKLPLIHWLPKKIHRKLLSLTGFTYSAKEENLNLLSKNELRIILNRFDFIEYTILNIKFFGFISNYIVIGKKIN